MSKIHVERQAAAERLSELGVAGWPVWEKEVSCFPWHYGASETCYLLAGRVTVTPDGGESITLAAGDLATFPAGMSCVWDIHEALRKHYRFG
ncbi:cupin domain-containing protein [Chitinilyticum litopenaei]|uniref:cupin domain-containing protein n=1 Tax=Chitinilyticum litopenaei TaxID=1121276 RepID=UPI000406AB0A|nr:cupin domain-containing protein [Chitinilyticum litopenaei]